jgi:hypothetical protein
VSVISLAGTDNDCSINDLTAEVAEDEAGGVVGGDVAVVVVAGAVNDDANSQFLAIKSFVIARHHETLDVGWTQVSRASAPSPVVSL